MKDAYTPEELAVLNDLAQAVARNADRKGFRDALRNLMTPEQWDGHLGELVRAAVYTSNLHGEASEFWEAFRNGALGKPCDKAMKMEALGLPELTNAEEEIADLLIRTLDQAQAHGVDVAKAVSVKMAYNATRPFLHGAKKA
jgi:NTP pyrophosphatase (non-canonical NTP hydrolase)